MSDTDIIREYAENIVDAPAEWTPHYTRSELLPMARAYLDAARLEAERDEARDEATTEHERGEDFRRRFEEAFESRRLQAEALSVYADDENWTFEAREYDTWLYVGPGDLPSDIARAALAVSEAPREHETRMGDMARGFRGRRARPGARAR